MAFSRRWHFPRLSLLLALAAMLLASGLQLKAGPQQKVQNTDPKLRLQWYQQHQDMKPVSRFKSLKWRLIGPDVISGRCTDVAVPRGSKHVIYVGTATGGLWKTENSGITWQSLFDEMPAGSIGDIAIDPSDSNVIWVGTGEANIFRASIAGTGVYKSVDGGKTWAHLGLSDTHTIGRVLIHPGNPDIVYVTSPGHEWTRNELRGVFKTVDGGKSWRKMFEISDFIGAFDLVMDPSDPNVLLTSMWNRTRERWSDPRPGPGDGIYKTVDGGENWKPCNQGLPDLDRTGRIGLSLCQSKPNVVYAYVDNHNLGRLPREGERDAYGRLKTGRVIKGAEVYRSDDLGGTWTKVSPDNRLLEGFGGTYGWVFGQIRVDPSNENTVYIMGLRLAKSVDGGKSWKVLNDPGLHGDHHGLWIDPGDPDYLINVNDGGVNISYDGGAAWRDFHRTHPVVQFYNVAYDMEKPFNIYGSVQDHGTYRGNVSHRPGSGYRQANNTCWEPAPGGEGTHVAVDPTNPDLVYSSSFYGRLMRSEFQNGRWNSANIYPEVEEGEPPHRGQWLAPTILSPHDPEVVYHGFQYLYRSMDRGDSWERISPDLSYNDPDKQGKLPFAIPYACLTSVSESPFTFGFIYAGTDDGRVHVTRDGGKTWADITAGLPFNKHVSRVVASKYDENTVFLTLNGRRDDDFTDYVYKSIDAGATWVDISGNIPGGPVNVIREDPKKAGILYVGTDLGVYVSIDGGKAWDVLAGGLPNTFVWDLIIHPRDGTLVIATNGLGMWAIDDVGKIRSRVE